jgi:hypothetical protein
MASRSLRRLRYRRDQEGKTRIIDPTKAESILPVEEHLRSNTLRLFLYGAPLTSYLRRKRQRYIPFKVETLEGAEASFRTVMVITGATKKVRAIIRRAVARYHNHLYSAAGVEQENQHNFRAVQYNYNRVARLLQHRSSFLSSFDYAECLSVHHKNPE